MIVCMGDFFISNNQLKRSKTWQNTGLTLIEVMISVVILAIMFVVAMMQVAKYINQSRDVERKTHLEKYRIALEEYFSDNHQYPPTSLMENCGSKDLLPYLPEVYCDPLSGEPYRYVRLQNGAHYELWTTLITEGDPVISLRGCDVGCGPDGNYNYGISDQQVATGDGAETGFVEPFCSSGGVKYCLAGQCSNCCPGDLYRCNGTGTACYIDYSCRN